MTSAEIAKLLCRSVLPWAKSAGFSREEFMERVPPAWTVSLIGLLESGRVTRQTARELLLSRLNSPAVLEYQVASRTILISPSDESLVQAE
jgi:Asp-tRNA(Asn)/Glu-tRNA(Gln) amidotransferase B subunit